MSDLDWDKDIWKIIDSYFQGTKNYLTKHQIDSYNTFLASNIPKTIRQFNPISTAFHSKLDIDSLRDVELNEYLSKFGVSPSGDVLSKRIQLQELFDSDLEKYKYEINIFVGATPEWNKDKTIITKIKNDGKGIYIGKPVIQEIEETDDEGILHRKTLYPNEARLKSLTYQSEIKVDLIVEKIINIYREKYKYLNINDDLSAGELELETDASGDISLSNKERRTFLIKFYQNKPENKQRDLYEKVSLGHVPIMLQSNICSLFNLEGNSLRSAGECQYDQGGYFIIDGKEKVIVAQERDIENKIYANKKKPNDIYKVVSTIRSAPENKFIPPRITKVVIYKEKCNNKEIIHDNTVRVKIPLLEGDIPLFIVFRALGFYSDLEIVNVICNEISGVTGDNRSKYYNKVLEILSASIHESSSVIQNQKDALDYLMTRISKSFLKMTNMNKNMKHKCLMEILKNHFLPHCGINLLDKGHFLAFMTQRSINVLLNIETETDRDSYMYKRVDISGYLLSEIFRDLYFRVKNKLLEVMRVGFNKKFGVIKSDMIENEDFFKFIDEYEFNNSLIPSDLIDRSIINDGFRYAFKNCWGLKDAPCKAGVVQDITRISYIGFISHLRRINTPLSKSAKVRAPHSLHGSSWGIMCPSETPDGGNIGLRKNLATTALITSGTNSVLLERLLFGLGVRDIQMKRHTQGIVANTRVFLNERILGYVSNPFQFYTLLKSFKRNGYINIYTSISWNKPDNKINVDTTSGRGVRPVFIVNKNNKIQLTKDIILRLSSTGDDKITWRHLIVGVDKDIIHTDIDGKCYVTDELSALDFDDTGTYIMGDLLINKLASTSGVIEYIDTYESNTSLIALNPKDLDSKMNSYDYCEISPTLILSVLATQIPALSMNQAPRNQFSTSQGKQALGLFATNYRTRMDVKSQLLHYPQKPLIKSKFSKYLFTDELPHGINAIVAIGCFSGYNQEDSIILNKDAIRRGLFRSTKFRTYIQREELDNGKIVERICNPTFEPNVRNMKSGDYTKLDNNGIIRMSSDQKVNENDILVGKCVVTKQVDSEGNPILFDNSEYIKRNEDGYVDRVFVNKGNEGQKYCKIRIRKEKDPELGDKFASRHGQKGTIGMVLPHSDLPRTKNGIVPDIIVNTHAFPSRMTIAQFLELLLGKVGIISGFESEISPFSNMQLPSDNSITKICDMLESLNFERNGNEILYSGITGKMLKMNYFIGPTFYQRLTHQVSDKRQSRDKGSKTSLARQPVSGRAAGGGGRVGEMERDCILSHGATSFLKESFMERSDKYSFWISCKTGIISAVNPNKRIYRDLSSDATVQKINLLGRLQDSKDIVIKEPVETTKSQFVKVFAPYAFKLFLQEIEASGIVPRLISTKVLEKWRKKTKHKKISGPIILTEEDKNLLEKDVETIRDTLQVMNKYHNDVKRNLLQYAYMRNITLGFPYDETIYDSSGIVYDSIKKAQTERAEALVDYSVGRGGDLFKWNSIGYNTVLGIDISESNIERRESDLKDGDYYASGDGAIQRLTNMKNGIHVNRNISEWARQSHIEFIVGDSSKLFNMTLSGGLYDEKYYNDRRILDIAEPTYKDVLKDFIHTASEGHLMIQKFGTATMMFSIHYLFDNIDRLRNFFINCSKTVYKGGYILLTTFDGPKVLDKLVQNDGEFQDNNIPKHWSIRTEEGISELPRDFDNGFNKKINVYVKSIGNEIEEYLVHPTLLITFAKRMGFTLESINNSSIFKYPTDTFDNILSQSRSKAELIKNPNLETFSNLNRYYIFKKTEELEDLGLKDVPEHPKLDIETDFAYYPLDNPEVDTYSVKKYKREFSLDDGEIITYFNYRTYQTNPLYRYIHLPMRVVLNNQQIYNEIALYRSFVEKGSRAGHTIGKILTDKDIYERNNCGDVSQLVREEIDAKKVVDIYRNTDKNILYNTLEYIYKHIKIGIYVKILNGVLYQCIPIINITNDLFTEEFSPLLNEIGITMEDDDEDVPERERINLMVEEFEKIIKSGRTNTPEMCASIFVKSMSGKCYNLVVGDDIVKHLVPQYLIYKDLLQRLLMQGELEVNPIHINDVEFIINVLDMPIVSTKDEVLINPFLRQNGEDYIIKSDNSENEYMNILPILSQRKNGKKERGKYIFKDFLIPDYHSYIIANGIQHKDVSLLGNGQAVNKHPNKTKILYFSNIEGTGSEDDFDSNMRMFLLKRHALLASAFTEQKAPGENIPGAGDEELVTTFQQVVMTNEKTYREPVIMVQNELGDNSLNKTYKVEFSNVSSNAMANDKYKLKKSDSGVNTGRPEVYESFLDINSVEEHILLYVDGFGSDELLTYSLSYRRPIIIIRDMEVNNTFWYEEYFKPYNFKKKREAEENIQANIFIISKRSILKEASDLSELDENIDERGRQENIVSVLSDKINKCKDIVDEFMLDEGVNIKTNSVKLSDFIFGERKYPKTKKQEISNSNIIYQHMAAVLNNVSFNSISEIKQEFDKIYVKEGNVIEYKILLHHSTLETVNKKILSKLDKSNQIQYFVGNVFNANGKKYNIITFVGKINLIIRAVDHISEIDRTVDDDLPFRP